MGSVFVSYSHRDAAHRDAFRAAAQGLENAGLVSLWHDTEVLPGAPWAEEIWRQLNGARVVVALLSPDFLQSPWCVSELARTLELRDRGLLDVVPVIVRQCAWRESPLGVIQALPTAGTPIENWVDPGAGWADVVVGIERLLKGERVQPALPSREDVVQRCSELLEADGRLMLLAPWRGGLGELAQEVARRTHGEAVTTLRLPTLHQMSAEDFYSELSAEPSVRSMLDFRQWLIRRSSQGAGNARQLVVLPYFGGPKELVRELGRVMRGVFEQVGTFSLLVLGLARCAELLADVQDFSLFSGIVTEHVPGMDLEETRTLLQRHGADPAHASVVHERGSLGSNSVRPETNLDCCRGARRATCAPLVELAEYASLRVE
jgi:hypothetical protein